MMKGFSMGLRLLLLLPLILPVTAFARGDSTPATAGAAPQVWVMTFKGAIGPAGSDWFTRALNNADKAGAELFVLQLDTPGGLERSMRDMVQAILASPVPVVTYVSPRGARAASAGTYILYASHIAAMAPATNLGAATPVTLGGGDDSDNNGKPSHMEKKRINDAVAYIRSLAEQRGRNVDWAEKAVRESVSLPAEEALKKNVVDLIAPDLPALLKKLDGRKVSVDNATVTLDLANYRLHPVKRDWRTSFLSVITDPTIAYVLLLVGAWGLIIEIFHPGVGLPGVAGGICLLIALYGLQLLPISWVGLGLILVGVGLMAAEAATSTMGVLGIGGVVAFLVGSVMLMDTNLPGYQIAMPMIVAFTVASVLILSVMLRMALRTRKVATVSGREGMIGSKAVALEDFEESGQVLAQSERWRAISNKPVRKGDQLLVRSVDGLTLHVEKES